jgi:hypothetical protein
LHASSTPSPSAHISRFDCGRTLECASDLVLTQREAESKTEDSDLFRVVGKHDYQCCDDYACLLFTSGSIIFEHVKVTCSMIMCNLFMIITFVYRILRDRLRGLYARDQEDRVHDS